MISSVVAAVLSSLWLPSPQAYYILDEILIGGYLQEVNKREVLRIGATQDDMMEEPKEGSASPVAAPAMFR